jgi:hypothetical protein
VGVGKPVSYATWERGVPESITDDSLWKVRAYRLALFLSDVGWHDVTKLMGDRRALGSIGANLAEGYSRGSGKDRARSYEYALGSARECRDWYYKGRHILGDAVVGHRLALLSEVLRLLLTMIPQQRGRALREEGSAYEAHSDEPPASVLLREVPY